MLIDKTLADACRARAACAPGTDVLLDAWSEATPDRRAAMAVAKGDLQLAGACGGEGWKQLAEGDVVGALRVARGERCGSAAMRLLEAEALLAAGAIRAGLERLDALHHEGEPAACLALARRRHTLGDHAGAERAATALPMHVQTALIGARAALINGRAASAFRFIEPFLGGMVPLPEPSVAGAVAVVAASILARRGQLAELERFARGLLDAYDMHEDMMPAAARVAWTAGLSAQAWDRFGVEDNPWMAAARLELAVLAGDAALASRLMQRAGPLGAPAAAALRLLRGVTREDVPDDESNTVFREGVTVHVWRTHPHRWRPWIEAARQTPADVAVFDLAGNALPDRRTVPQVVLDDGALIDLLPPIRVPVRCGGTGLWISPLLCRGFGFGHDWPEEETRMLETSTRLAARRKDAAVWVLGADEALANAHLGRPIVAVAPPGDPFWAGLLPERVWPGLRVVRADPCSGWSGAGARVAEAARSLSALTGS